MVREALAQAESNLNQATSKLAAEETYLEE